MIELLVRARLAGIRITHVRMAFSEDMRDHGRLRAGKAAHLAGVLAAIARVRAEGGADILYYPPSGASRLGLLRDVALLLPARRMFPRTVLHFHAAGLGELVPRLPAPLRRLALAAFDRPDATVRVSERAPRDDLLVRSQRDYVVPNGVRDPAPGPAPAARRGEGRILFVGLLCEGKGVLVLLEAMAALKRRGVRATATMVGRWSSPRFEADTLARVASLGLGDDVRFPGVLVGEAKHAEFRRADLLCFPTFFELETFGLVAIEAMAFRLPVVATRWRGLEDIVVEGSTGLLVPTRDPHALSDALARVLADPGAARAMGEAGRARFLERYEAERHLEGMAAVLREVGAR